MKFDLGGLWNLFIDFMYSLLLSLITMLKDLCMWLFEQLFSLAISILETFASALETLDFTKYISGLPSEVLQVLGLLGISTATQMIITAILIRLGLQLIPFVRFGS